PRFFRGGGGAENRGLSLVFRFGAGAEVLHDHRQHGDHHDGDDHHGEVLLHEFDVAEQVAGDEAGDDPGEASGHVEDREAAVLHATDPGHEGGEGADDGDEA